MTVRLTGDVLQAKLAEEGAFLTSGEVADLLRIDPKTVTRWCIQGRVTSIKTPGGHRRIPAAHVRAILAGEREL
jgi:excisionase family DNA binding protein